MDSDDSDNPSQVFQSNKKRRIIASNEIKVTPPTSGPTIDASSHVSHSEASEVRSDHETGSASSDNHPEPQPGPSSISSLTNLNPPTVTVKSKVSGRKRKLESSSSQAFLPTEKKSRERVPWSQVAVFEKKEDYEQSDIFNKLK